MYYLAHCGSKSVGYSICITCPNYRANIFHVDLYYIAFPKDHWYLKSIVCLVFLLETLQTTALIQNVFKYMTVGYSNFEIVNELGSDWYSIPLISGLGMFILPIWNFIKRPRKAFLMAHFVSFWQLQASLKDFTAIELVSSLNQNLPLLLSER